MRLGAFTVYVVLAVFVLCFPSPAAEATQNIIWVDPTDITSRNLIYGVGGEGAAPHGAMTFIAEDRQGTNPKFDVHDQDGNKWKVKLGVEAKPETAASRLLWAVGFFADEDYFVPNLHVENLPDHLNRGSNLVGPGGNIESVRLKRHLEGEKKLGSWHWKKNPFTGSRELNGLRVMMALMNNWDLKDVNTAIYHEAADTSRNIYLVSDLGASFGTTGYSWTHERSKGNLKSYRHSKFISKVRPDYVDFNVPSRPYLLYLFNFPGFVSRVRMRWVGKHIPRADAKWMGSILSQLSPEQIRDAFRAAGYSAADVEGFALVVEKRIAELNKL